MITWKCLLYAAPASNLLLEPVQDGIPPVGGQLGCLELANSPHTHAGLSVFADSYIYVLYIKWKQIRRTLNA